MVIFFRNKGLEGQSDKGNTLIFRLNKRLHWKLHRLILYLAEILVRFLLSVEMMKDKTNRSA